MDWSLLFVFAIRVEKWGVSLAFVSRRFVRANELGSAPADRCRDLDLEEKKRNVNEPMAGKRGEV